MSIFPTTSVFCTGRQCRRSCLVHDRCVSADAERGQGEGEAEAGPAAHSGEDCTLRVAFWWISRFVTPGSPGNSVQWEWEQGTSTWVIWAALLGDVFPWMFSHLMTHAEVSCAVQLDVPSSCLQFPLCPVLTCYPSQPRRLSKSRVLTTPPQGRKSCSEIPHQPVPLFYPTKTEWLVFLLDCGTWVYVVSWAQCYLAGHLHQNIWVIKDKPSLQDLFENAPAESPMKPRSPNRQPYTFILSHVTPGRQFAMDWRQD